MTDRNETNIWSILGELIAALAILAVLTLSFSQVTPANSVFSSASAGALVSPSTVFCGHAPGGDGTDHFGACHACRVAPVTLPAMPCDVEPGFGALLLAPTGTVRHLEFSPFNLLAPGSRAPPVSV